MAEYIEREAALLSLTPIVKRASERNRNIYSAVKQCVEAINWCPSADVAPVVRCKDCKFGVRLVVDLDGHEGIVCCHGNVSHALDWFCADGAKMEVEE